MPAWDVYRLYPWRGFHFGIRGVGVEASAPTGTSDLLFGALCSGVRALYGWAGATGLKALLDRCEARNPPFLISALFPFAGDVSLLPAPRHLWQWPALSEGVHSKRWRKVAYLSWQRFTHLVTLDATALALTLKESDDKVEEAYKDLYQGDQVWVMPQERWPLDKDFRHPTDPTRPPLLWKIADTPRVTIDRRSSASQVYQAGWVAFPPKAGLYFFVQWRDAAWQPVLESVLTYLSEEGIGGERSAGLGQFTVKRGPAWTPPTPAAPPAWMTLAHYYPTKDEAKELGQGWYDLTLRRGWVGAPEALAVRRRDVTMVTAGSVLPFAGAEFFGQMADVTPQPWPTNQPLSPILRYGFALPLAVPPIPQEVA